MKNILIIMLAVTLFTACNKRPIDFSTVKIGMTKEEVTTAAGEPNRQNDFGETSLWTYTSADRTVVFRHDTVYTIITSAKARIDSIGNTIQKADEDIKRGLKKMGETFDSTAKRVKNSLDTLKKK